MKTKHARRRMPIPQHEFGFTAEVFRLFSEYGLDGERLSREQAETQEARRIAAAAQTNLFAEIQPQCRP
jgi:chitinase